MNNTQVISLFVAGTLLLVLLAFFMIIFLIVQQKKQNAFLLEKQQMEFDHHSQILQTRIEVQENSMQEISKEIHDNIGQMLGFIQMNIKAIGNICTDPKQLQLVERTSSLAEQAIQDARNISHSLSSDVIKKKGLVTIIKNELDYIGLSKNMVCTMDVNGEPFDLGQDKELLIYRIAQEAIHNTLKHAEASSLTISLDYTTPGAFTMRVADDGAGFDRDKTVLAGGIGFTNMHQRATMLGGHLDIDSSPGSGSSVFLNITNENETEYNDQYSLS